MNKNVIIILAIFLVPLAVYFGLTRDKLTTPPSIAATTGAEIIKFSSPMCYECQQLEKVFEEVFPAYQQNITLRKIDVTQKSNDVKTMIKKYNVKLVPTTIFKDGKGVTKHRIEGSMEPQVLENYLKELING